MVWGEWLAGRPASYTQGEVPRNKGLPTSGLPTSFGPSFLSIRSTGSDWHSRSCASATSWDPTMSAPAATNALASTASTYKSSRGRGSEAVLFMTPGIAVVRWYCRAAWTYAHIHPAHPDALASLCAHTFARPSFPFPHKPTFQVPAAHPWHKYHFDMVVIKGTILS